ncbi:LPS export ABC transporter periplasmic protein LptC [Candidatus Pelagibacter sp. HIMB1695]|uniref:LPS export ABC transporter periplasmic protein LptC n=1 Tax=Candidatus Pelagibacter sp. HIMB1695 TaxID=3413364 RepID=UPI003F87B388
MNYKKFFKNVFIFFVFITVIFIVFSKYIEKNNSIKSQKNQNEKEDVIYSSNLIKDVEYSTKDAKGNNYTIKALEGEIDYSNTNFIYLKNVSALIELNNYEEITIFSDFGKYNSKNNDTIFSKNVIIRYLDNKITGEYLDFSINRNLMLISKNVIYSNKTNVLKADALEMNLETKNTKIFMYEKNKKVNLKTLD